MKEVIRQKQETVEQIVTWMKEASSVVIVDYRGLTVAEVTALRAQFRQNGVVYRVLKNTLIKRAADQLGIEGLDECLNGPTAVAFGMEDPAAAAKIIRDFTAKAKKMEVKAGIVGTQVIDAKGVSALADLPSKDVLVAKLLGTLNMPISGLVGVLSGPARALVCALEAVRKQKEETAA
nr:50S ribosomal protein L10 [bacterium]